jgi:hypothetical protein
VLLQLLAGASPSCPLDRKPIPRQPLGAFRPNFALMDVVRAAQDDAAAGADGCTAFRLQPHELDVDFDECLGRGGFASVYRGAPPNARRLARARPCGHAPAALQAHVGAVATGSGLYRPNVADASACAVCMSRGHLGRSALAPSSSGAQVAALCKLHAVRATTSVTGSRPLR